MYQIPERITLLEQNNIPGKNLKTFNALLQEASRRYAIVSQLTQSIAEDKNLSDDDMDAALAHVRIRHADIKNLLEKAEYF